MVAAHVGSVDHVDIISRQQFGVKNYPAILSPPKRERPSLFPVDTTQSALLFWKEGEHVHNITGNVKRKLLYTTPYPN